MMPLREVRVDSLGKFLCECCGQRAVFPFYLETYAPYTDTKVCYWLCKPCMSRLASMIETEIVGDPYDPLVREELQLRTEDLREMDMARKNRDLVCHPSN